MIVALDGRRIEADLIPASRPNRPVLVFLHEGLGSIGLWKGVPAQLAAQTGCAALTYSRYGNGFSETLKEKRPVSYMHDEARRALPELLDAFHVEDAVLVGHSDGASIALIYAGENGARLRGVVVEAPHLFVEEAGLRSIAAAKSAFETTDLPARLERYHADPAATFYGWNDVWLDPAFRDWNITSSAAGVRVPILAVQGTSDEYGTPAQLDALVRCAANAPVDTLLLAGCGHAPHRDRSSLVLTTIAAFVEDLCAAIPIKKRDG